MRALATVGLFDHHGYEGRRVRDWIVVVFHGKLCESADDPVRLFTSFGFRGDLDAGVLTKPLKSFFAPQLQFHPIEHPILCQASPNYCCGFATMFSQVADLFLDRKSTRLNSSHRCISYA